MFWVAGRREDNYAITNDGETESGKSKVRLEAVGTHSSPVNSITSL